MQSMKANDTMDDQVEGSAAVSLKLKERRRRGAVRYMARSTILHCFSRFVTVKHDLRVTIEGLFQDCLKSNSDSTFRRKLQLGSDQNRPNWILARSRSGAYFNVGSVHHAMQ
jgi:hypothetical protein